MINTKPNFITPLLLAVVYFAASAIITWWFIIEGDFLYVSSQKMILSACIAGAKWGIQIIAAFLFLKNKAAAFVRHIGFTCFVGSCILLPFCIFKPLQAFENSFLYSLIFAVLIMILRYYKGIKILNLAIGWFWGWVVCLFLAIMLQVFLVF